MPSSSKASAAFFPMWAINAAALILFIIGMNNVMMVEAAPSAPAVPSNPAIYTLHGSGIIEQSSHPNSHYNGLEAVLTAQVKDLSCHIVNGTAYEGQVEFTTADVGKIPYCENCKANITFSYGYSHRVSKHSTEEEWVTIGDWEGFPIVCNNDTLQCEVKYGTLDLSSPSNRMGVHNDSWSSNINGVAHPIIQITNTTAKHSAAPSSGPSLLTKLTLAAVVCGGVAAQIIS